MLDDAVCCDHQCHDHRVMATNRMVVLPRQVPMWNPCFRESGVRRWQEKKVILALSLACQVELAIESGSARTSGISNLARVSLCVRRARGRAVRIAREYMLILQ